MVLEYFKSRKAKEPDKGKGIDEGAPVLKEADEEFLKKIAAETPAPTSHEAPTIILDNGRKVKGKDAQIALMAGADQIPLPASPPEDDGDGKNKSRTNYWSYMPSMSRSGSWSKDWAPYLPALPKRRSDKNKAAEDLASAAESVKEGQASEVPVDAEEKEREQEDLTAILDQLNLSATSTRTFSLSQESAKLMEDFTQVLKDVMNGVPTAYDDMEKLLTRKDKEIRNMYGNLPPWLQTLVKSLPAKMTASLAPELMAAAGDKPGSDAQLKAQAGMSSSGGLLDPKDMLKKKAKKRVPSLKQLVSAQGAVAAMLKNILNFLKLRFPAFITGTNVLLSIAVFLLLFIFWYCHKRGREVRLEKEAAAAAAADGSEESEDNDTAMEESAVLGEGGSQFQGSHPALNHPHPKDVPLPNDP